MARASEPNLAATLTYEATDGADRQHEPRAAARSISWAAKDSFRNPVNAPRILRVIVDIGEDETRRRVRAPTTSSILARAD